MARCSAAGCSRAWSVKFVAVERASDPEAERLEQLGGRAVAREIKQVAQAWLDSPRPPRPRFGRSEGMLLAREGSGVG